MDYLGWWKWIVSWFAPRAPVEPSGEALLEAARKGDARLVQALLAAGTAPDETRTPDSETALALATRYGHAAAARALLAAGADPGAADGSGATTLIRAAENGHHGVIALIAATRPEVFHTESAAMALRQAALSGHSQAVTALLAGGVPPDASPRGLPPAIFAAATADAASVLELLEAGANVHAVDSEGKTPLHHAAAANEDACIRVLLTADANLDANLDVRDNAGRTPLDLAGSDFVRSLLVPVPDSLPPANGSGETSNQGN